MRDFKDSACYSCEEGCCRNFYIVLEDVKDKDWIQWLSFHKGVTIRKKWGKSIEVWFDYPCTHLKDDGSCAIYSKRPKICREYKCEKSQGPTVAKERKKLW